MKFFAGKSILFCTLSLFPFLQSCALSKNIINSKLKKTAIIDCSGYLVFVKEEVKKTKYPNGIKCDAIEELNQKLKEDKLLNSELHTFGSEK